MPYATAPAPNGPWTVRGDALPTKPGWAGDGGFWAPDVSRRGDGKYLMYFTGPSVAVGRMCLGAAIADSPAGPFSAVGSGPLVCNGGEGGDIDPSSFTDTNGQRYLLYKNDGNAVGQPTNIWLQPVGADGVTFTGGRTALLRDDRPEEAGVIEAPVLVKRAAHYVLFYSANGYASRNYQTSYATSGSITGPYAKAYRALMTTDSVDGAVEGPGGADVVGDKIYFHGWLNGGRRPAACTSRTSAGRTASRWYAAAGSGTRRSRARSTTPRSGPAPPGRRRARWWPSSTSPTRGSTSPCSRRGREPHRVRRVCRRVRRRRAHVDRQRRCPAGGRLPEHGAGTTGPRSRPGSA